MYSQPSQPTSSCIVTQQSSKPLLHSVKSEILVGYIIGIPICRYIYIYIYIYLYISYLICLLCKCLLPFSPFTFPMSKNHLTTRPPVFIPPKAPRTWQNPGNLDVERLTNSNFWKAPHGQSMTLGFTNVYIYVILCLFKNIYYAAIISHMIYVSLAIESCEM